MKRIILCCYVLYIFSQFLVADGTLPEGSGTEGDPYLIETLDNLLWLSTTEDVWEDDAYFLQTADIDATETQTWNIGDHDNNYNTPDEAMGFSPIGSESYESYFSGNYNGDNHVISNLFMNRPRLNWAGLFSRANYTEILNLGLVNVDFNCDDVLGGFAGEINNSTIINCFCTGNLLSESYVGGLVGMNYSSTISNSFTNGDFNATELIVGGLVGGNGNSAITNCYSMGHVIAGGVIPSFGHTAGGLVGFSSSNSTIINCFSNTGVAGYGNIGGLVGEEHDDGIVSNSFWNIQTSGLTESAGGTGKTNTEMRDLATYTNTQTEGLDSPWDFVFNPFDDEADEDIWYLDEDTNNGFPYLVNNTMVDADNEELQITNYELRNFPNPFNPSTTISFSINNEQNQPTAIEIYNIKGQRVDVLSFDSNAEFYKTPRIQRHQDDSVVWDASKFASGVYFYKLNIADSPVKKMLLMK
jgi:hypothetical protein